MIELIAVGAFVVTVVFGAGYWLKGMNNARPDPYPPGPTQTMVMGNFKVHFVCVCTRTVSYMNAAFTCERRFLEFPELQFKIVGFFS